MWSWSTNVTDRRTDGRTTCHCITAICTIVHRAVKTEIFIFHKDITTKFSDSYIKRILNHIPKHPPTLHVYPKKMRFLLYFIHIPSGFLRLHRISAHVFVTLHENIHLKTSLRIMSTKWTAKTCRCGSIKGCALTCSVTVTYSGGSTKYQRYNVGIIFTKWQIKCTHQWRSVKHNNVTDALPITALWNWNL